MLRAIVLVILRGTGYANDATASSRNYQFFERYAVKVVRSPQSFILWSATLVFCLSYSFIYDQLFANGQLHSSWSSFCANSISLSRLTLQANISDLTLRQVWVRGDQDGALSKDVLDFVWEVQDSLVRGLSSSDFVLVSPTLFWNNSLTSFEQDSDIISTINMHIQSQEFPEDGVRFSFPPKSKSICWKPQFVGSRLVSCDALIISVIFPSSNARTEDVLEQNFQNIRSSSEIKFSSSSSVVKSLPEKHSRLEYLNEITPMSKSYNNLFYSCYAALFAYIIISFSCIRAVRFRFGLLVAFIVETILSMTAASAVMKIFGIDTTMVPKKMFPFVFLVLSTENMFRLVNSLSYTRPEQPALVRVGVALGKVGLLSTVTISLNILFLLIPLFFFSAPISQVSAFSIISLAIDYFLHMTYFLAVLSIDVRRLELEDLIQSSLYSQSTDTDDEDEDEGFFDITFKRNPLAKFMDVIAENSFRMTTTAGIIVTGIFLVFMQLHYINGPDVQFLVSSLKLPVKDLPQIITKYSSSNSSVLSWQEIRSELFDGNHGRSLFHHSGSPVLRFCEPDFLTLKNAHRHDIRSSSSVFASGYIYQFLIITSSTVISSAALISFLLRESRDEEAVDSRFNSAPVIITKDMSCHHSLDIIRLATSSTGVIVSVGLDHKVYLWQANSRRQQSPVKVPLPADAYPITSVDVDSDGKFVAISTRPGVLYCWNIPTSRFVWSVSLPGLIKAAPATTLFITEKVPGMVTKINMIVVCKNGILYQIPSDTGIASEHLISDVEIISADKLFTPRLPKRIISVNEEGIIISTMLVRRTWMNQRLQLQYSIIASMEQQQVLQSSPLKYNRLYQNTSTDACTIVPLHQLGMILWARGITAELIDVQTGTIIKTFHLAQYRKGTLKAFHDRTQHCPFCGCSTIATLCILYCERDSGMLIMHSFTNSSRARNNICLRVERDPREKRCIGFEGVIEKQHWLENVTGWEITDINLVMGIRRKSTVTLDGFVESTGYNYQSNGLRDRFHKASTSMTSEDRLSSENLEDAWEGWTMGMDGSVCTYELRPEQEQRSHQLRKFDRLKTRSYALSSEDDFGEEPASPDGPRGRRKQYHQHYRPEHDLLVSHIGTVARLGHRSIVMGFGNIVKVLYFKTEEIINEHSSDIDDEDISLAYVSRRRRARHRSSSRGSISSVDENPRSSLRHISNSNAGSSSNRGSSGLMRPRVTNGMSSDSGDEGSSRGNRRGGLMGGGLMGSGHKAL
ncbi:sterol-sensing domain of SREBP cleavage-activation-domain-containing protein [Dipodascopsis uninucleata]